MATPLAAQARATYQLLVNSGYADKDFSVIYEFLASELEIEPMTDDSLEVVLQDSSAKEMVRLRVGKRFDEGPGRYVQRLDEENAPIYLTSSGVSLTTGSDAVSFWLYNTSLNVLEWKRGRWHLIHLNLWDMQT